MPSFEHEAIIALFQNRPTLAAELLRDHLEQDLPAFRVALLPLERIEALADALLDFRALADLEAWMEGR